MATENLKDLFREELKDIYNGEQQILKALPKLAKAAHSAELREALEDHLEQTQQQKERLEKIFQELGIPAKGKTCDGIKGIIQEGDSAVDDAGDAVIDACIIAAAQKVEHYEWATYGTLKTWAQRLGEDNVARLLEESEEEEKAADATLTRLAESFANEEAEHGEGMDEDEDESGARTDAGDYEFEAGEEELEEVGASRGRGRPSGSTNKGSSGAKNTSRSDKTAATRRRGRNART